MGKVRDIVKFPSSGLLILDYAYDLFAVSNHYGKLEGGIST